MASNFSAAHPLVQAGTEQDIIDSNGNAEYYFWYEVYAGNPNDPAQQAQQVVNPQMYVNPGDDVAAGGFWIPGSNAAVFGICNWTNNVCINFNFPNVGEPSNTTEWIVEATTAITGNVVESVLPQFSPVNFINGCWAATTTLSTSAQPNTTYPISGPNGVTGSVTCQNIMAGPSPTSIDMQLPPPYSTTSPAPVIAGPSAIGSNGSDFQVLYRQP